jgi:RNase adaptor protein for sRNA GlmZ degradation
MDSAIIVVSGLPRSGTSLMMQMLENGGVAVVTDNIRTADTDNPRGYYEFEKVKRLKQNASWLPETRGKAFKMVSQLLYDLPGSERYRIIFMERDTDEMLRSQDKMLQRLNRPAAPHEEMKRYYAVHLERLHAWLGQQPHIDVVRVNYNDLIERPEANTERIREFLNGKVNAEAMAKTVDPSLYRNRRTVAEGFAEPGGRAVPPGGARPSPCP